MVLAILDYSILFILFKFNFVVVKCYSLWLKFNQRMTELNAVFVTFIPVLILLRHMLKSVANFQ